MNNVLAAIIPLAIFIIGLGGTPLLARSGQSKASGDKATVRVYYPNPAVGNKVLISFKAQVLETNYEQNYHVMEVSQRELDLLARAGLRVEADLQGTFPQRPKTPSLSQIAETPEAIPSYTCYRTVEETYAAAEQIVRDHPTLATWINVGNSWKKSENVGGYDIQVLILTNSAIPGPKPKLFLTGAIHAREYTTSELVTRFAEYLVNNYGTDADATWILDYHEVHLLLQTNPDGRKQAEAGFWWRKNTNQNYCSPTSNYRGADLNRNYSFRWNCCGGSSDNECDETYHGPYATSEPEIQAVEGYMASIFPAQRGPQLTDPAPDDATGVYIDVHSYGRLVLWPWSHTSATAPNVTQLQTLGRKFAYWNGYSPEQSVGLYPNDGASDDHAYGTFGVAAYTIELGTAYFQSCTDFENTIWPANIPVLIYAAKVARTPYLTPSGPDVTNLSLGGNSVPAGTKVTLNATVDDTRYNNSNGTEATQDVAAAEYYVDVPPWAAGSAAFAMKASDGLFGSTVENVTATIDTTSWNQGRHIIFVRGKDAGNHWGAFSAVFLTISGRVPLPPSGFSGSTGWENGEPEGGIDDVMYSQSVGPHPGGTKPECSRRSGERARSGNYALMIAGSSQADYAYCYYRVFDNLSIPVTNKTKIGYYIYHSAGTPQVAVDGHFMDGSTIRDSGIKDQNGVSIHPAARNDVMNQWIYVEADLSPVAGKTLKTLMFAFDNGNNKYHGPYRAYVDDLRVFEGGGGGSCSATVPGNHWKGEYFCNQDLSGLPAMTKDDGDGALDKQWGTTSPGSDCGIGPDHFSVRWTKAQNFPAGLYTFTMSVDDGGRFYIDGEKKLESWKDQPETPYTTGQIALSGDHTLKLEYYENGGLATAKLSWTKAGDLPITACQANVPGNRWKGEYFNNQELSGLPAMTKDDGDGALDKQWGTTSPGGDCGIGPDHFSVRWTKAQNFPAGLYTFTMSVDDGGRFYIDDDKKIDTWKDQSETSYTTGQIALSGNHTLKLEYYENAGDATARLSSTRVGEIPSTPMERVK